MGILCKIFRFALDIFSTTVDAVAGAVQVVGTAAVDVLSELLESAGDAVSGIFGKSGSTLLLLLVGAGLYLFSKNSDEKEVSHGNQVT